MKWLFVLLLAVLVFGGAAFFSYDLFVKPERKIIAEKSGEIPFEPVPDISLPEFQAAAKLRQESKLAEAGPGHGHGDRVDPRWGALAKLDFEDRVED